MWERGEMGVEEKSGEGGGGGGCPDCWNKVSGRSLSREPLCLTAVKIHSD